MTWRTLLAAPKQEAEGRMDASHVESIAQRIRAVRIAAYWLAGFLIASLPLADYPHWRCLAATLYLMFAPYVWHDLSERQRIPISTREMLVTPALLLLGGMPWVWALASLIALAIARIALQGIDRQHLLTVGAMGAAIGLLSPHLGQAFPVWVTISVALWLLLHAAAVAWLSYRQTLLLNEARKTAVQSREALAHVARRLSKYLSPQLHRSLFAAPMAERHPYRRWLTVFFADLCGFTKLTDSLEPEPLAQLLNEYLQGLTEIALAHGGTVDKFMGDGVMVFFGDPDSRGRNEDTQACVRMAMEIQNWVQNWSQRWQAQGFDAMAVRMGIASGVCTVGDFGAADRLEYTVIGRAVNLASRLESIAAPNRALLCAHTAALLNPDLVASLGPRQLRGFARPVQVYELVCGAGEPVCSAPDPVMTQGVAIE